MMLKKFNDFLDDKNVTSITESEEKKDKKWYTNVLVSYSMNVDPWSKDSIFTISDEEQKKRLTSLARTVKECVTDCEEKIYGHKPHFATELICLFNGAFSVKSTICLFDKDIEDIKKLDKTNKYAKELYKSIESALKNEGLLQDGGIIRISSYNLDKENPDKEVWYFYDAEKDEWKKGPKEVEPKDRIFNEGEHFGK